MPISQFLMFESLDSILLPENYSNDIDCTKRNDDTENKKDNSILTESEKVYGTEVASELTKMKIFVVGSGAIGCELLKTFALLGVSIGRDNSINSDVKSHDKNIENGLNVDKVNVVLGENDKEMKQLNDVSTGKEKMDGLWKGLESGGIVLTDMDMIEKSNLNRQLLFRERHVGMSKATVAAKTVRQVGEGGGVILRID